MAQRAGAPIEPARGPEIRRILVATDLSPASDQAVSRGFELARRLGTELLIVSVIDDKALAHPGPGLAPRVDQVRERREVAANALVARGRREGVPVTFLVWQGEAGPAVVEAAAAEGVDMIIVGSHNRNIVGRLLIGSVSEFVVRHAGCPVLVVRPLLAGTQALVETTPATEPGFAKA